jgi:hypothetical protein
MEFYLGLSMGLFVGGLVGAAIACVCVAVKIRLATDAHGHDGDDVSPSSEGCHVDENDG